MRESAAAQIADYLQSVPEDEQFPYKPHIDFILYRAEEKSKKHPG